MVKWVGTHQGSREATPSDGGSERQTEEQNIRQAKICMSNTDWDYLVQVGVSHSVTSDCNPVDCSLRGSSVHRILQERTLEWVVLSSSRVSSQPRDQTRIP